MKRQCSFAELYDDQGRYAEAQPLYKAGASDPGKVLGPEHADVDWSLNDLAHLDTDQGRYAEASPFCQRALAIREKALGPEHLDVVQSLSTPA
jgi:tetratricopeptide (TPR) repeat protein